MARPSVARTLHDAGLAPPCVRHHRDMQWGDGARPPRSRCRWREPPTWRPLGCGGACVQALELRATRVRSLIRRARDSLRKGLQLHGMLPSVGAHEGSSVGVRLQPPRATSRRPRSCIGCARSADLGQWIAMERRHSGFYLRSDLHIKDNVPPPSSTCLSSIF